MGCELAEEGLSISQRADQWLRIFSLPTEYWTQYQYCININIGLTSGSEYILFLQNTRHSININIANGWQVAQNAFNSPHKYWTLNME